MGPKQTLELFTLVTLVCCHCCVLGDGDVYNNNKQRKAVDSGKVVFSPYESDSGSSGETYRMISSGGVNPWRQQQVTASSGQDKPLVFYSSRSSGNTGSISGSSDPNGPTSSARIGGGRPAQQQRPKSIPLSLVRQLNEERDVLGIIDKYVSNVRLKDVKGQKVLVDLAGNVVDINTDGLGAGATTPPPTTQRPLPQTRFKFRYPANAITTTTPGPAVVAAAPVAFAPVPPTGNQSSVSFATTTFSFPTPQPPPLNPFLRGGVIRDRIGPASKAVTLITSEAKCEPEQKAVPIKGYEDRPDVFVHPKCVRIPQCGGCCGSNLLSCEPIATEPVQVEVRVFEYNADLGKLELTQTEKLQMESHTKCKCGCKIKAEDCAPNQYYDEHNCKCVCRNEAESFECFEQSNRQWNYNKCECECYDLGICDRGFFWNTNTCECQFDTELCARMGPRPQLGVRRNNNRRRRREENNRGNFRNVTALS